VTSSDLAKYSMAQSVARSLRQLSLLVAVCCDYLRLFTQKVQMPFSPTHTPTPWHEGQTSPVQPAVNEVQRQLYVN